MPTNRPASPRKERRELILVNPKPTAVTGRNVTMHVELANLLYIQEGQLQVPDQFVLRVRGSARSPRARRSGTG